jgi:folate-binding protein YgfZ
VAEFAWQGARLTIARVTHTGEDGYDIWVSVPAAEAMRDALTEATTLLGGCLVGGEALDALRVESGIPGWGSELTETAGPLEARLDRAISRSKGCYVGQEIIARIDARGQVNNRLVGLLLERAAPGDPIQVAGAERPVGRVTSVVHSAALDAPIALGYLRREHEEPGTRLRVGGPDGAPVRVAALPFVPWRFPTPIYLAGGSRGSEGGSR